MKFNQKIIDVPKKIKFSFMEKARFRTYGQTREKRREP